MLFTCQFISCTSLVRENHELVLPIMRDELIGDPVKMQVKRLPRTWEAKKDGEEGAGRGGDEGDLLSGLASDGGSVEKQCLGVGGAALSRTGERRHSHCFVCLSLDLSRSGGGRWSVWRLQLLLPPPELILPAAAPSNDNATSERVEAAAAGPAQH